MAAHRVCRRQQDLTVELLDGPAVLHELDGQVVQQFRMAGAIPGGSEVTQAPNEARPEVVMPDAIHDHTRSQRIGWAGDLIG